MFRWDYDYSEIGDVAQEQGYVLADFDGPRSADSDEWTIGSSSSISSGSMSPVDERQGVWEGEALTSHFDTEAKP